MMLKKLTDIPVQSVKLLQRGTFKTPAATLTSRSTRGEPLKLKPPFPYEEKKFNWWYEKLDPTVVRVSQENAKVIVVEGPVGAGKSAFCEALADEFEMKYYPQPTMDEFFVLRSGYDLRQHDHELPEDIRSYDHKNFCVNPFSFKAGLFQCHMLFLRFHQYIHALCHLYNTGQGVILERSFQSDYVFMKAMKENKFVSSEMAKAYLTINKNISTFFPAPHLIIYLDMPVPVVQERIKTRNYSHEQNSPALTFDYLSSYEKYMKEDYLKSARKSSEILMYDWSDGGNVDVVIDDIENLDLYIMRGDRLFVGWWISRKDLYFLRKKITNEPYSYTGYFNYPWYELDEVFPSIEKSHEWYKIISQIPECKYDFGFNPQGGDKIFDILFTFKKRYRRMPRHHIRPYEE